ncbi:type I-F CRISPR-associated protein Csy3 [Endozoicomonas gorgoniicola]|uniref:Type I-F CRISPR-associated protein Csy3 n=1 Tax=Endozoicomonas gorgoniicola TaxID=1234144 RepID=A0ABT3N3J6_9GAMM|nr:type I-F CRISPR-associated protein Csy3 [Endozoicomonas gorgoniicola]MCW7555913.1 type I-F CRISPR-associated protein Csy3 [Endozoicomonas gorgoniicola]
MKLCSQHAQQRSIYLGKGLFFWVDGESREHPLSPETTTIAATKDNYSEAYAKGEVKESCKPSSLSYANPQTIQEVYMPPEAQALIIRFSVTIRSHSGQLHRCDSAEMKNVVARLAESYKNVGGYRVLARRYLENFLLGNWLWENQCTLGTEIRLKDYKSKEQLVVDNVETRRWSRDLDDLEETIGSWVDRFEKALTSPKECCSVLVEAKLILPLCAEVWPSQKFTDGEEKNKLLSTCDFNGEEQVIFTRHKLGAAMHQIDDWYPGADTRKKISAYCADRENLTAHRHPVTGKDYFSLLKKADEYIEFLESEPDMNDPMMDDANFIMACHICGGMRLESKG